MFVIPRGGMRHKLDGWEELRAHKSLPRPTTTGGEMRLIWQHGAELMLLFKSSHVHAA